jgi:hypothetical protein
MLYMPSEDGLQEAVTDELEDVRMVGLGAVDELDREGLQVHQTPNLDRAASKVPGHDPRSLRSAAIEHLLKYEISRITSHPSREWLPSSFGLTDKTRSQSMQARREKAAEIAGHSSRIDFGRTDGKEDKGLRVLAAQIIADCLISNSDEAISFNNLQELSGARYVPRPEIHQEYRRLVESGAKLVILVGQAGMGKTTLALALTANAPIISITDGKIDTADLQDAFRALDISPAGAIAPDARTHLALLLGHAGSNGRVVLDGLTSADELNQLLPSARTCLVVATSRTQGAAPPTDAAFISVGAMGRDEATQFARTRLLELSFEEAEYLAGAMDDYPLLLQHACTLFKYRKGSVADFCDALRADRVQLFREAKTGDAIGLLAVLTRLVENVEKANPLAVDLLICMCGMPVYIPVELEFLDYYASLARSIKYRQAAGLSPTTMHAIKMLEEYGLIGYGGGRITMHDLTRRVLRDGTSKRFAYIGAAMAWHVAHVIQSGQISELPEDGLPNVLVALLNFVIRLHAQPELEGIISDEYREIIEGYLSDMVAVFSEMPNEPAPMLPPEFMQWVQANLRPPDQGFIDAMRAANDDPGTSSG